MVGALMVIIVGGSQCGVDMSCMVILGGGVTALLRGLLTTPQGPSSSDEALFTGGGEGVGES